MFSNHGHSFCWNGTVSVLNFFTGQSYFKKKIPLNTKVPQICIFINSKVMSQLHLPFIGLKL